MHPEKGDFPSIENTCQTVKRLASPRTNKYRRVTLLGCLPKEFATIEVENTLMRRTAVATHESPTGRQTVLLGKSEQNDIVGVQTGVENDGDIHHDVDEIGVRAVKRTQTAGIFIESQCECLTRMDHNVLERLIGIAFKQSRFVPAPVRAMIKNEAKIVDLAIVFARLKAFE